jgi:hypothetical protein
MLGRKSLLFATQPRQSDSSLPLYHGYYVVQVYGDLTLLSYTRSSGSLISPWLLHLIHYCVHGLPL